MADDEQDPPDETRGQRLVRLLRGSATNPDIAGMTTDQIMEMLRGA